MDFPVLSATKPLISKIIALQSFFFARPRVDVDLVADPDKAAYGQKYLGLASRQNFPEPIPVMEAVYDYEFFWNYHLRIRKNSSKTAYNIIIDEIYKGASDYIERIETLVSLREGEALELDYRIQFSSSKTGQKAQVFLKSFPDFLKEIEIIISYTNESRTKF